MGNYEKKWIMRYEAGYSVTRTSGPQPREVVEQRIHHIIRIYEKILKGGLWRHPPSHLHYFDQFPVGDVLERDGRAVLMIANGQHRLAALTALGNSNCPIIVGVQHDRSPFVVRRGDIDRWPLVRLGVFSRLQALAVFDRIFEGRQPRRIVRTFALHPSVDIGQLAADHLRRSRGRLSRIIGNAALRLLDGGDGADADLASYMLFDTEFIRLLIDLGEKDAAKHADELADFLFGPPEE